MGLNRNATVVLLCYFIRFIALIFFWHINGCSVVCVCGGGGQSVSFHSTYILITKKEINLISFKRQGVNKGRGGCLQVSQTRSMCIYLFCFCLNRATLFNRHSEKTHNIFVKFNARGYQMPFSYRETVQKFDR